MQEKLKSYLETIAVLNDKRFDAITGLLGTLRIGYEIQEKTLEYKRPIYEEVKPAGKPKKEGKKAKKNKRAFFGGTSFPSFDKEVESVPVIEAPVRKELEIVDQKNPKGGPDDTMEVTLEDIKPTLVKIALDVLGYDRDEIEVFNDNDWAALLMFVQENCEIDIASIYQESLETCEVVVNSDLDMGSESALDLEKAGSCKSPSDAFYGELLDGQMSLFDDDDIFLEGRYGGYRGSSYGSYGYGSYGYSGNMSSHYSRAYTPRKIVGYNHYTETIRNIIIPLSKYSATDGKKIVLMAHYDAVPGSTGANDNGSAVAILIAFAQEVISKGSPVPMEIVFTDREESGAAGSTMYAERCGKDILEVINLDTCGVGKDIITCDWSFHPSEVSWNLIYHERLKELRPVFVRSLPYCDADNMRSHGFNVTGICSLPEKDVNQIIVGHPSYTATYFYMHNGKCDDIKYINYDVMAKIVEYLELLLEQ